VVSFIAPHSLTARALVVAPNDVLTVLNRSKDVVDVIVDGRPIGELAPEQSVRARFAHDVAQLAQVPGTTFYRRLREKFGRLSS
jgi:NAD+ kinase